MPVTVESRRFHMRKTSVINKLEICIRENKVDTDIIHILKLINSIDGYYTVSSCSGRLQIIELPNIGDKINSRVLGKWHHIPDKNEILDAIKGYSKNGYLFLMVQPPLIHISCANIKLAVMLRNTANASGFKYSNIRSISPRNIVVEVIGCERMELPLYYGNKEIVDVSKIEDILTIARDIMARGKYKISRFYDNLLTLRNKLNKDTGDNK